MSTSYNYKLIKNLWYRNIKKAHNDIEINPPKNFLYKDSNENYDCILNYRIYGNTDGVGTYFGINRYDTIESNIGTTSPDGIINVYLNEPSATHNEPNIVGFRVMANEVGDDNISKIERGIVYYNSSNKLNHDLIIENNNKYNINKLAFESPAIIKKIPDLGYGIFARGYCIFSYNNTEYIQYGDIVYTNYYRCIYNYKIPIKHGFYYTKNHLYFSSTSKLTTLTDSDNNELTIRRNSDGSFTVNGKQNTLKTFTLKPNLSLPAGDYIISMTPSNGSESSYRCQILAGTTSNSSLFAFTDGPDKLFTIDNDNPHLIRLRFAANYVFDNVTFKILIRDANITDNTYDSLHYKTITDNIYLERPLNKYGNDANYIDFKEKKYHMARKNLLKNTATNQTKNDITFTVNYDGSVTCNGTSTSQDFSLFRIPCYLTAGSYIISGCPIGGTINTYSADIRISPNGDIVGSNVDIGNGATIVINESGNYDYTIRIQGGYTCENLIFYPMIREANVTNDDYETYIEETNTNIILPELSINKLINIPIFDTEVQPSLIKIKGKFKNIWPFTFSASSYIDLLNLVNKAINIEQEQIKYKAYDGITYRRFISNTGYYAKSKAAIEGGCILFDTDDNGNPEWTSFMIKDYYDELNESINSLIRLNKDTLRNLRDESRILAYDTNYQETYRLDLQDILEDADNILANSTSQSEIDDMVEEMQEYIEEVKSHPVT